MHNHVQITYLEFAHVLKNLIAVLSNHAHVPHLLLDVIRRTGPLNFELGLLEFALNACRNTGRDHGSSAAGSQIAGTERVCRCVSLVLVVEILIVFLIPLLGLRHGTEMGFLVANGDNRLLFRNLGEFVAQLDTLLFALCLGNSFLCC